MHTRTALHPVADTPLCHASGRPSPSFSTQSRVAKRSTALAASKGSLHGTDSNASTSQTRAGELQQGTPSTSSSVPGLITAPGRRYTIDLTDIIEGAPRIRVRTITDRQRNQLAELAVLNERLAGGDAAATRKRIEYLKRKPRTWQAIYQYLTRTEAAATLAAIEEANRKVEDALREGSWESKSVTQMRDELEQLQTQVGEAQERLQATQQRVDTNLQRVQELRQQAMSLEHAATLAPAEASTAPTAAPRVPDAQTGIDQRRRGLHSSLDLEPGLRNHWYPAAFTAKLQPDMLLPVELFGETWVLFRGPDGGPACVRDECAHRACPLSLGRVVEGHVECPYHGWQYDGSGACTKMPSTRFCKGVSVTMLPCSEADGFVWVWPGEAVPGELPTFAQPPAGFDVHAEIEVEVPVEHGLLMENLLDLAHAPFTHTSTFAKGWPVPDAVKFHATKLLTGNWDPYPITMSFQPPCMVLSTIGLAQPGKIERGVTAQQCANHLHQLHVCLPARRGHTRLLYRMSLDFLGWLRYVPGIEAFWKGIAGQVLGEDLVLVTGQQERLLKGGDTWGFPVSYDKLAVRYRRWRNAVGEGDGQMASALAQEMTAGELFTLTDSDEDDAASSSGGHC